MLAAAGAHLQFVPVKDKKSQMQKRRKTGIILFGITILTGFKYFIATFSIPGEPKEHELKTECDYEGLRKVRMTKIDGNATTNNSIHIVKQKYQFLTQRTLNPKLLPYSCAFNSPLPLNRNRPQAE